MAKYNQLLRIEEDNQKEKIGTKVRFTIVSLVNSMMLEDQDPAYFYLSFFTGIMKSGFSVESYLGKL